MMDFIFSLNRFFLRKKKSNFVKKFDGLLFEKLAGKVNFFDRSFSQYKCQVDIGFLANSLLLIFLPFFIFIPLVFLIFFPAVKSDENENFSTVAVLPSFDFVPNAFSGEKVSYLKKFYNANFNLNDLLFCYKIIFKFFFHPFFWLKCIYIILSYSGIAKTTAKEILVSNEYSFTSSVLTLYLNSCGKIVSNCMHGEKALCLRDCFSTYDNFYVWDDYYVKLLESMDVKANFKVSSCNALRLHLIPSDKDGDIIFYLQGFESNEELILIRSKLIQLSHKYNASFFVKKHPRYFNESVEAVFLGSEIISCDFSESISSAKIIASNYSTVLFQVYVNRLEKNQKFPLIAINDLTDIPEGYIMQKKADIFFSKI